MRVTHQVHRGLLSGIAMLAIVAFGAYGDEYDP